MKEQNASKSCTFKPAPAPSRYHQCHYFLTYQYAGLLFRSVVEVGQVLVEVVKQALSQERVTLGIFESAEILET